MGINNFTDKKYASSILINASGFGNSEPRFYYPAMPRNWFGGGKLVFKLDERINTPQQKWNRNPNQNRNRNRKSTLHYMVTQYKA